MIRYIFVGLIAALTLTGCSPNGPERAPAEKQVNGAKIYGDAARGKSILDKWCVACHLSGPTLNDQVPSLSAIADNSAKSEGYIRAFLMQPHKPMPPLDLTAQEIEDIIAALRDIKAAAR